MSPVTYEPIKLNQTNRYAGYQFHARVRIDGIKNEEAFRYLILTVCEWMLKRVPENDRKVPELQLPSPDRYAEISDDVFQSYHFSIGYALDITPIISEGIWTLRLKEPDVGREDRPVVAGRFFTTRVGIRLNDKGYTELGIKIDVTDPASVEKEVPFAYRPGFVRNLAIQPEVHFEQVCELKRGPADRIDTDEDYKRLLYMLENDDNQLPVAVFTYARPGEKKPAKNMSIEDFVKSDQAKSFLQFSGVKMPGAGMGFPVAPAAAPAEVKPVLPYDVDAFCGSAFAYAYTAVLSDRLTEKFRSKMKKDFGAGDVLLCGAKKFRGGISVIAAYPGEKEEARQKAYDQALMTARSYSKHKAPYDFGAVLFEAEARKLEQHARVMELINSGTMEEQEKISRMSYEMEMLLNVIDDKDEDIKRLKDQVDDAFQRGEKSKGEENAQLKDDIDKLRRDVSDRDAAIEHMQGEFQRAREINNVITQMRSVTELPETNEDVVRYFRTVYGDRLDFTKRGAESAALCTFKPSSLWKILYIAANQLVDVFADSAENVTEEEVQAKTGYRMSFREGSTTREQADMMKLRVDVYEGKTISVEPHLKLRSTKGELTNQRLHFWYDQERKRIVIGYIGEHLESVSSRHV